MQSRITEFDPPRKLAFTWQGSGVEEKGIEKSTGRVLVEIDPRYFA